MITLSYDGSAVTCGLASVIFEDPKRKWIVIKVLSYPSEKVRKRIISRSAVDIACPDLVEGEVQYNSCKAPEFISDEDRAMLFEAIEDNWSEDNEPLAEFIVKKYEKKVRL